MRIKIFGPYNVGQILHATIMTSKALHKLSFELRLKWRRTSKTRVFELVHGELKE